MAKILRWIFLIFLGLLLVLVIAAAIFISRMKPETYRSRIESFLSEKTGYLVNLGEISFSKEIGLGLEAKKAELRKPGTEKPIFLGDRVLLQLDILSLLGGRVTLKAKIDGGTFDYAARPGANHLVIQGIHARAEAAFPSNFIKVKGAGRLATQGGPEVAWRLGGNPKQHINFEIKFKKDALLLTGEVFPGVDPPRFQGEIKVNQLNIEEVMQLAGAKKGDPILSGTADGLLQIGGTGKTDKEIQNSLVGQGRFEIQNGTLLDFNIVQHLLKQITILPALGELLQQILPPEFQETLNSATTAFEFLEVNFSLQGGQISTPSLILKSSKYLIEAEGSFDFDHNVNFKARLVLLENLSKYLIQRIRELELVANEQERIVIPFVYRGVWPKTRPLPDLGYLAEKFFKKAGMDWLEQGLGLLEQFGGQKKNE